jgi:hypothetical protein
LKTPSDYLGAGVFVSRSSAGNSVLLTIDMRKEIDSSSGSDVDFSSQGSNSVINPIVIEGSEFVG